MKNRIFILILMAFAFNSKGQQDAQFTHYMFNTQAVNPAYAGSRGLLTITGLHRSQWLNFPGAPTTQTLTMHTPIFNDKLGFGLSVINDKVGPTSTRSFYADFAYKIKISEKGKLSFGLKGGLNRRTNDLALLETDESNDPSFTSSTKSDLLPNFGFGLYYFQERYYFGASVPNLLQNDFIKNDVASVSGALRHYFIIAGAVFDLSQTGNLKLKPTTLFKLANGAPLDIDLTATFLFKDKFWFGPMYRLGDGMGALIGYTFTPQLSAGYSFDWSATNSTARYNNGSHEIMLRYDLKYNEIEKIKSPRYF